jgi:hypothetical protein
VSSQSAIEQGVVTTLRRHFADLQGVHVGLTPPNLQPPPAFGQWYVGVGQANAARGPSQSGDVRDEVFTLQIGVTFKTSVAPYDRAGWATRNPARNDRQFASQSAVAGSAEFTVTGVADAVAGLLDEQYQPINDANTFLPAGENPFTEPFHRVSLGQITDKPSGWVFGDDKLRAGEISFILITATGARRVRSTGSIDDLD